MSIRDFKAALRGGVAAPNRYEVVVNFPAVANGDIELSRSTSFLAVSTQIPGSNLGIREIPFRGRVLKLPGDRTFEEWTCSFINDTNYSLRDAFERWHNAMNSYNTNVGVSDFNDILSEVTVYQLDNADNRTKRYDLLLAWPSVVGPIELAADSNDTFEQFEVTMQYSDMFSENVTS